MDSKWIEAEFILISLQWFSQQYLKWQGWVGSAPFSPPWPPSFVPSSSASPCWPFLSSASAPLRHLPRAQGLQGLGCCRTCWNRREYPSPPEAALASPQRDSAAAPGHRCPVHLEKERALLAQDPPQRCRSEVY